MPRLIMSRPCAASALARASTAKAFSSPIRSKAAIVRSIVANLPRERPSRNSRGDASPNEVCTSADQAGKIKRRNGFIRCTKPSWLAAKTPANIAPNLETDIRVGVIAEIHAAEIERTGRKQVGTSVVRIGANRGGSGRHFFMLALLAGGIGRCRKHEER